MTTILICGGGTGGHVYPALALADELVARGTPRTSIQFVGANRGIEGEAVPAAGYEIALLPGRGLQRSFTGRALAQNLRTVLDTGRAFVAAHALIGRLRPSIVVGVGGYASLPGVVATRLRRIPVVVHESDAHPGLANRIAVALGARPAVSLPGTPLRGAVVTGNPIRPGIAEVQLAPVVPALVAVVGGSLGARRINQATLALADASRTPRRRRHPPCQWRTRLRRVSTATVRVACTARRVAVSTRALRGSDGHVVCRRQCDGHPRRRDDGRARRGRDAVSVGATPDAPGDHQTKNAEVFAAAGAAVLVPDEELDGARLRRELDELLADPVRLARMSDAARGLGRVDATARFADLVEEVARARR